MLVGLVAHSLCLGDGITDRGRGRSGGLAPIGAKRPSSAAKFALPTTPAATMARPRLTDLLAGADGPAVVSIVAPAGYGKTTLLRQWADHLPNVGYVALEEGDNDPVALISGIATALGRVEPLDPALLRLLASPGRSLESTLLPGLVEAIWARRTSTVLMLDDAHHLDQPAPLDVIAFLMLRLPPTLRLAVAARRMLPLPLRATPPDGPPAGGRSAGAGTERGGRGRAGCGDRRPDPARADRPAF